MNNYLRQFGDNREDKDMKKKLDAYIKARKASPAVNCSQLSKEECNQQKRATLLGLGPETSLCEWQGDKCQSSDPSKAALDLCCKQQTPSATCEAMIATLVEDFDCPNYDNLLKQSFKEKCDRLREAVLQGSLEGACVSDRAASYAAPLVREPVVVQVSGKDAKKTSGRGGSKGGGYKGKFLTMVALAALASQASAASVVNPATGTFIAPKPLDVGDYKFPFAVEPSKLSVPVIVKGENVSLVFPPNEPLSSIAEGIEDVEEVDTKIHANLGNLTKSVTVAIPKGEAKNAGDILTNGMSEALIIIGGGDENRPVTGSHVETGEIVVVPAATAAAIIAKGESGPPVVFDDEEAMKVGGHIGHGEPAPTGRVGEAEALANVLGEWTDMPEFFPGPPTDMPVSMEVGADIGMPTGSEWFGPGGGYVEKWPLPDLPEVTDMDVSMEVEADIGMPTGSQWFDQPDPPLPPAPAPSEVASGKEVWPYKSIFGEEDVPLPPTPAEVAIQEPGEGEVVYGPHWFNPEINELVTGPEAKAQLHKYQTVPQPPEEYGGAMAMLALVGVAQGAANQPAEKGFGLQINLRGGGGGGGTYCSYPRQKDRYVMEVKSGGGVKRHVANNTTPGAAAKKLARKSNQFNSHKKQFVINFHRVARDGKKRKDYKYQITPGYAASYFTPDAPSTCIICGKGKPCGNSCIDPDYTCHKDYRCGVWSVVSVKQVH